MKHPLPALVAYGDSQTFRALPFAGGLWEQPYELVRGMRIVAGIVSKVEEAQAERARRKAETGGH